MSGALRIFPPSPTLAPYVTLIFTCAGQGQPLSGPMPALDAQVSFRLDGNAIFEFGDGRVVAPAGAAVVGPLSSALRMHLGHPFRAVGASLTAAGWVALFGVPAEAMRDQVVELAAFWGDGTVERTVDALHSASGDEALAWLLQTVLTARLATNLRAPDWRLGAIEDWIGRSADLSIDELSDRLMLSPRQVARVTLGAYGLTPKLLAMRHRAARAAARIAIAPASANAYDFGYADQSHMIRDFRRFLGVTPTQFVTGEVTREIFVVADAADASLTRQRRDPSERIYA